MQVKNYKEPFYHSIIEDFYSDVELSDILVEIKDLKEHSLGPSETGDPRANTLMTAVQLDRHYINRRNDSKILTHNRKMFYLEEELKDNPFARYLPYTNDDVTQLNYYKDGAEYKHHADHGVLSAVTILHDEPKQYIGGDLVFTDYNYIPKLKNNTTILFSSFQQHGVTPCAGNGRYSINQFYFINR
jgi:predicted 2-oxoglutarate/Fe(II)-dependent dioxygenase YbiX